MLGRNFTRNILVYKLNVADLVFFVNLAENLFLLVLLFAFQPVV